ncbi:MAG: thioredoxin family protein [Myxococcales bacterium]
MDVKVLGPGCAKCKKLFAETEKALSQSGVAATLTKVEKLEEIMAFGVMMTPALVIDGQVRCTGRVPGATEIATWLATAAK